jgi:FG-GAP repeat
VRTVQGRSRRARFRHLLFCAGLATSAVANAQLFVQQGAKLVGSGAVDAPPLYRGTAQGSSVAVSTNGSTVLLGGPSDNNNLGAVWVFTRNGSGNWSQQGSKLVGSGTVGFPQQGASVALSGDGNTALVGGPYDNGGFGAVWVFTRDVNGNWSQEANKLLATGAVGLAHQGDSVALSADGNTALVGGGSDSNDMGAAWVFTRDANGNWSQQGSKLVGSGATPSPDGTDVQGGSVALSADGNTALLGAIGDTGGVGAVWVFTRDSNGNWSQQGNKLTGSGAGGESIQGASLALSADGNTAIWGGPDDNGLTGAVWVFTRDINGDWSQQGSKLVGSGAVTAGGYVPGQGFSVALSGDGNTAFEGSPNDDSGIGGFWVFTRDGNGNWTQQGGKLLGSGASNGAHQGASVAISGDSSTAVIGGPYDDAPNVINPVGAAWIFLQNGSTPCCSPPSFQTFPVP